MSEDRDTDPEIPVVHDPAEVFAHETEREKLDNFNDRNPWFRWSALVVGTLMIGGALIRWCQG